MKRTHFTIGILAALAALTMSTCSDAFLGKGNPVDPQASNYQGYPTITDPEALRDELMRVRAQGYCVQDQELEDGVRSVAVPVHDAGGRVVAAINTSAHATRVSIERVEREFLPQLQECARQIDQGLAGRQY